MQPPRLAIGGLYDDHHRFGIYWPRLRALNVPTPMSRVIPVEDEGMSGEAVVERVHEFMTAEGLSGAFVRSGYKAATRRFREGSMIARRSREAIERTLHSLATQHTQDEIPHGGEVVVRERLDLDYCQFLGHDHSVEVRFFIEDGAVLCHTGDRGSFVPDCPRRYPYIEPRFSDVAVPWGIAETVAEGFSGTDHPWSVDTVLDAHGNWWVTELHVNGVYWSTEREAWMNICGQGDCEALGPMWVHGAALPASW